MRYSLLSRFRGTLLGAALGENFPCGCSTPTSLWEQMAILGAESLIEVGRFDLQDWQKRINEIIPKNDINHGAIAATLPVALLFFENQVKQRQNLQQLIGIFVKEPTLEPSSELIVQDNPKSCLIEGALAVGYAIALSLMEKLNPALLIPQILTYLEDFPTPLLQQLKQVQTFIGEGTGLEQVFTQLRRDAEPDSAAIALAFYCFLSTPEDFRLTVTRARRSHYQPQITSKIAGALSGAYNSTAGIPVGWSIAYSQTNELLQISDRLFSLWSGIYDPRGEMAIPISVAAPQIIQPR